MANITIKRYNGSAWDIHYPKTIISQVVNLSTTLANMQDDIDGKIGAYSGYDRLYQNGHGTPYNNLGSPSITEMALFQEQFNNKIEFYDISKIKFYTSNDNVNWTEYTGFSDTQKKRFVGGDINSGVNIPNLTPYFRIEIEATNYVFLNALYMYWSSQSHSTKVKVWKRRNDNESWYQHTNSEASVSSWPGHLFLPFSSIAFVADNGSSGHYGAIRIDFQPTWSGHATYGGRPIILDRMQIWGGYPAGKRTIYSVDENKVVTFPSNIRVGANNVIIEGDSRLTNARPASDVYSWAKASTKPSYTASEVGAAAASHNHSATNITSGRLTLSRLPTGLAGTVLKGNDLNDPVWGSISWSEIQSKPSVIIEGDSRLTNARPASDVYSWAKASSKPSYTAAEVGAAAASHNHTKSQITDFPSNIIRQVSFSSGTLVVEVV